MRRYFCFIAAFIFCISAFAQTVDKPFVVPKIAWSNTSYATRLFSEPSFNPALKSDSLSFKTSFKLNGLLLDFERPEPKSSVVIQSLNYNHSIPNIPAPRLQTMNWWQALGTIGVGLTRGLVFDNYNSNYTLDD